MPEKISEGAHPEGAGPELAGPDGANPEGANPEHVNPEGHGWGWLVLFASSATLICCALPILLVTLGMGAVSAAIFANVPGLTWLALNKTWLFAGSALMLSAALWSLTRPGRACPTDPRLAAQCERAHKWNIWMLIISISIWGIGFFAAYLLLPITLFIGG